MIDVRPYCENDREVWNQFVARSKNGTFILQRDYIEYHADRFEDFSLLFEQEGKIIGLLPASRHGDELRSHGGLTYGGFIMDCETTLQQTLGCFEAMLFFLADHGIANLIYKRVPHIYYKYPADEDLYALAQCNAALIRRDVSSCIFLPEKIPFSSRRKRNIKKAEKAGLIVNESHDFAGYITMVEEVLKRHHDTVPTHSGSEITLLARRYPSNIKLFVACRDEAILAGALVFETGQAVHTQYLASNEEGRKCGALDLVIEFLVNKKYHDKTYLSFGISSENEGKLLNTGLLTQKQEFGGRAVAHDFYSIAIDSRPR